MTVVTNMRDRLAAALQIELRNRNLPAGSDIAYAVADRALEGTQFETLTTYVGAVEQGGTLDEINARLTGVRAGLGDDPILGEMIQS